MLDEDAEHPLEMPPVEDQQPVETLRADGSDEALRDGVRLRSTHRRLPGILCATNQTRRLACTMKNNT